MDIAPRLEPAASHRRNLLWRPGLVFVTAGLLPAAAARAQSRIDFTTSLRLVQLHDDNIFSRPSSREEDLISRLSPRLGAGYRSATLSVLARCALDAELFQRHPELNTARARQEAAIDVRYLPTGRTTFTASASYSDTQNPGELNVITGIEAGRAPARAFHATQSVARTLGPLTKATVAHRFAREQVSGYLANGTQVASLALERELGPTDEGRVDYSLGRFTFGPDVTNFHVLTLGWSREITPLAHFELKAGPRASGGRLDPEISAGLRARFRRGDVGLAYLRTQTVVVGLPRPVTAEGVSGSFSRQLLRGLRVAGGSSVFRSRGGSFAATVYRLNLDVTWRLTRLLSLAGSHQLGFQRGGIEGAPTEDVSHNVFLLSVVAASAGR